MHRFPGPPAEHLIAIIAWAPMVKQNNNKSFTLVEILIVSAIIVVMSGGSLAIFFTFREDKSLNNQVTIFTHALELAKTRAQSGDVSLCANSDSAHISGYSVIVTPLDLTLLPGCDTAPTPQTYPIPTGIVYVTPSVSVRFDSIKYQGVTRRFPLKNTGTNKCKYVQIDETGLVTNGDLSPCP